MDQSYFAFGAGAQYDLTPKLSVLSNFTVAQVGASDTLTNKANLRFHSLQASGQKYMSSIY